MHTRDFAVMTAEAFNVQVERHEKELWDGLYNRKMNDKQRVQLLEGGIRSSDSHYGDPFHPGMIECAIHKRAATNCLRRLAEVMVMKK